jgi:hypothetical protein
VVQASVAPRLGRACSDYTLPVIACAVKDRVQIGISVPLLNRQIVEVVPTTADKNGAL